MAVAVAAVVAVAIIAIAKPTATATAMHGSSNGNGKDNDNVFSRIVKNDQNLTWELFFPGVSCKELQFPLPHLRPVVLVVSVIVSLFL